MSGWIMTHSGKPFYPARPAPSDIDILDIAHALSMTCRYGGHARRFYSVAEHCVLVASQVPAKLRLAALL
ncbi:MAG: phosphohydrolase, partial [Rhizobiaceae bacterium]